MRIFLTGLSGLFGLNAVLAFLDRGHQVWGSFLTHPVELPDGRALRLDVRDKREVLRAFSDIRPEVVIHAAAATSVDACEVDPDKAKEMNVDATRVVTWATFHARALLVHLSTDQVFGGAISMARESTPRQPVNVYGRTKLEGEVTVESLLRSEDAAMHAGRFLIIRTNFFGWGPPHKPSLSGWILTRLRAGEEVPGFTDVYFTPILVNDLIDRIEIMIEKMTGCRMPAGLFHVAGADRVSKYEFARLLAEQFGENPQQVRATRVAEARLRAPRPLDMSLNSSQAKQVFGFPPATLEIGLARLKGLEVQREVQGQVQGWPERICKLIQPHQVSA